jgi:hypothetical protein
MRTVQAAKQVTLSTAEYEQIKNVSLSTTTQERLASGNSFFSMQQVILLNDRNLPS